jgi:hypothetical protein
MIRRLLFAGALLVLATPAARAGGINLAAGPGCWAENPVAAKASSCDRNVGLALQMTASFALNVDMPRMVGAEIVLEGQLNASGGLPDWWELGAGGCRSGALSADASFAASPNSRCLDGWRGQAFGGVAGYTVTGSRARMRIGFAVSSAHPVHVPAGTEFYCAHVNITNERTADAGACAGCGVGMCWTLNQITVRDADGSYEDCTAVLDQQCVSWQDGGCQAGSTRNVTWGQVKGLYR